MSKLTQKRLKELLSYDENTGYFTWKVNRGKIKVGNVAGYTSVQGYIRITIDRKTLPAHRLVFLYLDGKLPSGCIDHINGIRDDNRVVNLRKVSNGDNNKNSSLSRRNKSGQIGVSYCKRTTKWKAHISHNYKRYYLGYFYDINDAIQARKDAELKFNYHPNHGSDSKYEPLEPSLTKNTQTIKYYGTKKAYPQDRLKDMLSYNPDTGVFTWKINICSINKGDIAGCIHTNKYGYRNVSITLDGFSFRAHQLVFLYMTGKLPKLHIDHIDGDATNNKWDNLREVSQSENNKNRKIMRNNTSGYTGVRWRDDVNKWTAFIGINSKTVKLGCFTDLEEAIAVRKKAEIKYGFSERHGK